MPEDLAKPKVPTLSRRLIIVGCKPLSNLSFPFSFPSLFFILFSKACIFLCFFSVSIFVTLHFLLAFPIPFFIFYILYYNLNSSCFFSFTFFGSHFLIFNFVYLKFLCSLLNLFFVVLLIFLHFESFVQSSSFRNLNNTNILFKYQFRQTLASLPFKCSVLKIPPSKNLLSLPCCVSIRLYRNLYQTI
jgi:hypothetical protein